MNILVINVSLRPNSLQKLFPVGLGYIVTAMKNAGIQFDLLDIDAYRYSDLEVEELIRKQKYDVVCMGCIVTGYRIVKGLTEVVKRHHPNAVVIAGNSVATSIPDTLLMNTRVDIAVMSEGDITIVELLRTLEIGDDIEAVRGICYVKDGRIVNTGPRDLIKDISSLPFLDFTIFDIEVYIEASKFAVSDPLPFPREEARALPVNTARGCVAQCNFCYHVFKEMPYRYRSPESITGEIKKLIAEYNLNFIMFWDELTFFSKKQTVAFVDSVLEQDLHFVWAANCRGNLFNSEEDIEIIKKMKRAGCLSVGYSLESADEEILKAMNKHVSVDQFARQTQLFHKAGVYPVTSLVLGYPQETPQTVKKTFDCCIENKIFPSAGYLLPQPGSGMYQYAIEHGFITSEEEYLLKLGDRQDLRLNMTSMSDEVFEKSVFEGLRRCNEAMNIGLKDDELIKSLYYRNTKTEADTACLTEMVIPCESTSGNG